MQLYISVLMGSLLASVVSGQEPITLTRQAETPQITQRTRTSEDDSLASLNAASSSAALSHAATRKLGVCVVTADFWGVLKFPQESGRGVRATLKGGGGEMPSAECYTNAVCMLTRFWAEYLPMLMTPSLCVKQALQLPFTSWQLSLGSSQT